MLRGEFDAAGAGDPADLLDAYGATLGEVVDAVGVDAVVESAGLSVETVEAVQAGDVADLYLADAAAILATAEGRPDAEAIAAEARDILLLGMTTAVLDVETLVSEMNGAMEPKELQQKVEGRTPVTLAEYAQVHYHLREHTE